MIIDAHIHCMDRENEEKNLLSGMDDAGIEISVLLPLPPACYQGAPTAGNEEIYDIAGRHPDRLSFGVFADPRQPDAIDTVKHYADLGAKVFKMVPTIGFFPDDPVCMDLYETLADLKMPILSHTGATDIPVISDKPRQALSSHYADPIRFDGLSRMFPALTWVLAHMGFPWSHNAWFVSWVNKNVYLDVSGGGFWSTSLVPLYNSIGRQIPIDFERVIWGSDNCLTPKEHIPFTKEILTGLGCEEKYFPKIYGQTANRIFNLGK